MPFNLYHEDHGGLDPAELRSLGLSSGKMLDFSVNSNPFGPSPRVLEAIRSVDVSKYPDRHCGELSTRLADANTVQEDDILPGNGTAELIWLIAMSFIKPGDPVLILGPTFGEYSRAARALGAEVIEIRAQPPRFLPELDLLLDKIQATRPRLVFFCNPNNPTGCLLSEGEIHQIKQVCSDETILVLDEAYRAFYGQGFFGPFNGRNTIVLRSMTKDFALAGIRLGYALADRGVLQSMRNLQPAWSVNAVAQAAGLAVLDDLSYYERSLIDLHQEQERFFSALAATTGQPVYSSTHFCVVQTPEEAGIIRKRLLERQIQVRDCASFGLPDHIRLSSQKPDTNTRLLNELRQIFHL
ncbi:MAG: histidinol-phosphate aminotransferase family protein [Leptolinea sp.]|nr:histidinol-phosphate aminotransferase family protein [Leptolinea sp.]